MRKLLKAINLKSSDKTSRFLRIIITCLAATVIALPIMAVLPKKEVTKPVNIDAGVNSVLTPCIKAVNDDPWSKLIIFFICGGAVIGESSFTINKRKDKGSKK